MIWYTMWEYIGLWSFLLISFYFTRVFSLLSSMLVLIVNKFGDVFFCLGIVTLLLFTLDTSYIHVSMYVQALFVGVCCKSALLVGFT